MMTSTKTPFPLLATAIILPLSTTLIIESFSFLQIFHLIIYTMISSNSSSHSFIIGLSKSLPFLTGIFPLNQSSIYHTIFHPIWFLILSYLSLHVFLLLVAQYSLRYHHKPPAKLIQTLSWAYLLHSRFIYFPIQIFLINLISLYHAPSSSSFYQQTGWLIASIALLVLNSALAIFKEFFIYQINHQPENHYAMKTNMLHQTILVYKFLGSLLVFLGQNNSIQAFKASSILHILTAIVLIGVLYLRLPYYNFNVLKFSVIMASIFFSFSIVSLIFSYGEDPQVLGATEILIALLPIFTIKIVLLQFRALFTRILRGDFFVGNHAIHFGLLIEEFIADKKTVKPHDNSFFPEIEHYHGILSGLDLVKSTEQEIYSWIVERLRPHQDRYPDSICLSLYMAKIYLVKISNIAKSLEMVRKVETHSTASSIPISNSIYYMNQMMQKVYRQEDMASSEDRSFFFKYYEMMNKIKIKMIQETKLHIKFWRDLQNNTLDSFKNYNRTQAIDQFFTQIQRDCQANLTNFRKHFTPPLLIYAAYLHNVRHLHHESTKILRSLESILFNQDLKNEFDPISGTSAVIIVSLDKTKPGIILDASGSLHNLFGLAKKDLIDKKLEYLFPSVIAKNYQQYIQQYSRNPVYKLDLKEKTFGKTATNEIFELEINFQLYPYLDKKITAMVLLKKLADPAPILIANNQGLIMDCSKTLENSLQKESSANLQNFRAIQNISPEFDDINHAFNLIYTTGGSNHNFPDRTAQDRTSLTNSQIDFDETARTSTARTLIRAKSFRFTPQKSTIDMPTERAEVLCETYTHGKFTILDLNNANKLKAYIQVKPFLFEEEVYKIITITNLKRSESIDDSESLLPDSLDDEIIVPQEFTGRQEQPIHLEKSPNMSIAREFPFPLPFAFRAEQQSRTPSFQRKSSQKSTEIKPFSVAVVKTKIAHFDTDIKIIDGVVETHQNLDKIKQMFVEQDFSVSITNKNHEESLAMKTLRDLASKKKLNRRHSFLQVSLYFLIIIILIISAIKYIYSKNSIHEINQGVSIINTATLRLLTAISLWQWSLIIYTGANYDTHIQTVRSDTHSLASYNNLLKEQIAITQDQNLLQTLFNRNIDIWQLPVRGDNNLEVMDSFTATSFLLNKYITIGQTQQWSELFQIPDIVLTFNNTGNDYIVSSNQFIDTTGQSLQDIVSDGIIILEIILGLEVVAIFGYISFTIMMIFTIHNSYKRLCKALTKTQESYIALEINQLRRTLALLEDDIERDSFVKDSLELFIPHDLVSKEEKKRKRDSDKSHQVNMKSMNRYLGRQAGLILLLALAVIGLFTGTVARSIHTFNSLGSVNEEISVLSNGCFQSNMLMSTLLFANIFGTIPSMLVQNESPTSQIYVALENFNNLNAKLIERFISQNYGENSFIVQVLQKDICGNLDDIKLKALCDIATDDQKMGLLSLNTDYYNTITNVLSSISVDLPFTTILVMYANMVNKMVNQMKMLETIYPLMISNILESFTVTVESAKKNETEYFLAISLMTIVYTVFIFMKPMKDLQRIDYGRRRMLKIIPFQAIQSNKALKFYLLQDFKIELELVKSYI